MPKGQLQRTLNYFSLYFSSPLHRFRVPFIFYAYFLPFRFFLFIFLFLFLLLMSGRCSFAVFLYSSFYPPLFPPSQRKLKFEQPRSFGALRRSGGRTLFSSSFFFSLNYSEEKMARGKNGEMTAAIICFSLYNSRFEQELTARRRFHSSDKSLTVLLYG